MVMSEARVSGLNVHPIKSCGAIEVQQARIVETGLEYDRLFMLIDKNNKFISQRNHKAGQKLAQIKPRFGQYDGEIIGGKNNGILHVHANNFGNLDLPLFLPPYTYITEKEKEDLPPSHKRIKLELVEADIHNTAAVGAIVSEEANKFFSDYLDETVRLIRVVGPHFRQIKQDRQIAGASPYAGYADAFPLSLATEASWRELCTHPDIVSEFENGIDINRVRANIEVKGEELEPYEEDYWRKLKIGNVLSAYVVKPNIRCVIPQRDQETGHISKPVKTALIDKRKGYERGTKDKGNYFAQNLIHIIRFGTIAVGDRLTVLELAEEPNVDLVAG
jgi:uncharacterized protein YcbX